MNRRETLVVWGVQSPLIAGQEFGANIYAKSLDGSPLGAACVLILDENSNIVTTCELTANADGVAANATVTLCAPEESGYYPWRAVLERDGKQTHTMRPLPFSVTPKPLRKAMISVTDEMTGTPLSHATAYFFNKKLSKVKPLAVESDSNGVVNAMIVTNAAYDVRVEREGYDEGHCTIEAGEVSEIAHAVATMRSGLYDNPSLGVGDIALLKEEAAKRQRDRVASLERQIKELEEKLATTNQRIAS